MNGTADENRAEAGESGEFNVVALVLSLWRKKLWIAGGTLVAGLYGVFIAMTASPVYQATAIVAPKEAEKGGGAGSLSSKLGGLSGIMGLQMGSGNTSLDRIDIMLRSYELAETVITTHNLLPDLFPALWDRAAGKWKVKDSSRIPNLRMAVDLLRFNRINVAPDTRKNLIRFAVNLHDSLLAKQVVDHYLQALNETLVANARSEAEANRAYLEEQLDKTPDPMLREKISNLISYEIEKYMLVSSRSIDVLERPLVPLERLSPKKKKILLMALFTGFLGSVICVLVFLQASRMLGSKGLRAGAAA